MKFNRTPQDWQKDSSKISTETVQFWSGGQMASQMPLAEARILIETGNAFVISDTAIGLLTDGRMDS